MLFSLVYDGPSDYELPERDDLTSTPAPAPERVAAPEPGPAAVPPGLTRRETADHHYSEAMAHASRWERRHQAEQARRAEYDQLRAAAFGGAR